MVEGDLFIYEIITVEERGQVGMVRSSVPGNPSMGNT